MHRSINLSRKIIFFKPNAAKVASNDKERGDAQEYEANRDDDYDDVADKMGRP
jgi:hypothetical protein